MSLENRNTKETQAASSINKRHGLSLSVSLEVVSLSLSLASRTCSNLISPSPSHSLVWNGTWNDQHTFPLGGLDWFMWELLQSFAFLVEADERGNRVNWWHRPVCIFILLEWGCDARIHQGVLQSQGNNEEERRCVVADWWERGENKENKIDGREKNISHYWQLWITVNEVMRNKSVMWKSFYCLDLYYREKLGRKQFLSLHIEHKIVLNTSPYIIPVYAGLLHSYFDVLNIRWKWNLTEESKCLKLSYH